MFGYITHLFNTLYIWDHFPKVFARPMVIVFTYSSILRYWFNSSMIFAKVVDFLFHLFLYIPCFVTIIIKVLQHLGTPSTLTLSRLIGTGGGIMSIAVSLWYQYAHNKKIFSQKRNDKDVIYWCIFPLNPHLYK